MLYKGGDEKGQSSPCKAAAQRQRQTVRSERSLVWTYTTRKWLGACRNMRKGNKRSWCASSLIGRLGSDAAPESGGSSEGEVPVLALRAAPRLRAALGPLHGEGRPVR
jgi:hypothetical protein